MKRRVQLNDFVGRLKHTVFYPWGEDHSSGLIHFPNLPVFSKCVICLENRLEGVSHTVV